MTDPIIVYRLGSMGDTVVALPCFHLIRGLFPERRIIVLTNTPVSKKAAALEDMLKNGGFIDDCIAYPMGTRDPIRLLRLAIALRRTGAKTLIHLQGGRGHVRVQRDIAFFKACGIKAVIAAPGPDFDEHLLPNGEKEYEAQRLVRCLSALGPIDLDDPAVWDLRLTDQERAVAQAALKPLVGRAILAVNTGGKSPAQDWGDANWTEVFRQLGGSLDVALMFVGAAEDSERAERLIQAWSGAALNLCGRLSPRETAAALERAIAFVGHDSGPMHVAAAVQTRCVALFGANNMPRNMPRRWHPYGNIHRVIHEIAGIDRITPERVVEAIRAQVQIAQMERPIR